MKRILLVAALLIAASAQTALGADQSPTTVTTADLGAATAAQVEAHIPAAIYARSLNAIDPDVAARAFDAPVMATSLARTGIVCGGHGWSQSVGWNVGPVHENAGAEHAWFYACMAPWHYIVNGSFRCDGSFTTSKVLGVIGDWQDRWCSSGYPPGFLATRRNGCVHGKFVWGTYGVSRTIDVTTRVQLRAVPPAWYYPADHCWALHTFQL